MYIEPLALFILGEVVVVFIIICSFLFYKSRLLRVLLALWQEMRLKRLYRDNPLTRQIAQLTKQNQKLSQDLEELKRGGAESYSNQVQARLDALADQEAEARADDEADAAATEDENEETHRTRAILRAFYEFEAARADPHHQDIRAAEDTLLEQLKIQLGRDPNEEESEYIQGQTAELLARVAELEPLEAQHADALTELENARQALNKAEGKAAALTAIKTATSADTATPLPPGSAHEEEIYRLKCERFDTMESMNRLRLQLEKVVSDGDTQDLLDLQNEQLKQQQQYIRETDTAFELLESDLAAAQVRLAELADSDNTVPNATAEASAAVQKARKDSLAGYAEQQKTSMAEMQDNLRALRSAEKAEERETLVKAQEDRLSAMARAIEESDTCVAMMETELQAAHETINQLQSDASTTANETEDKLDQDADEMASMLARFVTDSEDLMQCLKGLEQENGELRDRLINTGVNTKDLPPLPQPAVEP